MIFCAVGFLVFGLLSRYWTRSRNLDIVCLQMCTYLYDSRVSQLELRFGEGEAPLLCMPELPGSKAST